MSDEPGPGADEAMEYMPDRPMEHQNIEDSDMLEAGANNAVPPVEMPQPQPWIHDHIPGDHCIMCACNDCRAFYGAERPVECFVPQRRPGYGYIEFVNYMRNAAAQREEERQSQRQAELKRASEENSSDKTKIPKKKNVRQAVKRRRV